MLHLFVLIGLMGLAVDYCEAHWLSCLVAQVLQPLQAVSAALGG